MIQSVKKVNSSWEQEEGFVFDCSDDRSGTCNLSADMQFYRILIGKQYQVEDINKLPLSSY